MMRTDERTDTITNSATKPNGAVGSKAVTMTTDEDRHAVEQIEAATQPEHWRFLPAAFGRCAHCRAPFQHGELILWHIRTRETVHPICCANKYSHLADWIEHATFWQRRR